METNIQPTATLPPRLCQNSQCRRTYSEPSAISTTTESPPFCSHQCAYIHTLDSYRQVSSTLASPVPSPGAQDTGTSGTGVGGTAYKYHTSMLIRCGIDPWAPAEEIRMRQQFCHTLVAVLDHYWPHRDNLEYAWSLENLTYRLSHPLVYCNQQQQQCALMAVDGDLLLPGGTQRYRLLCDALLTRMRTDSALVDALFSGAAIHPTEFYQHIFGHTKTW
ncbi:hypothetical protein GQ54DRAFT_320781 [Martensiomyces pterosporus]|nr:hypothetical protein GQ54DRAFT_320781 [Martensiomyces pterosporus]